MIRSLKMWTAVAFLFLFLMPSLSSANLVNNGDFEDPSSPLSNGYYQTVLSGASTLTGWTVGGTSIDIVRGGQWFYSGQQAVDMAGTPGPGSILQSISTNAGGSYLLSFYVSSNADSSNTYSGGLKVYWGGTLLDTISSPARGSWDHYTYNVNALASTTALMFATDIATNQGPLLDTVSLQAVPIPAAAWLLGSGLIGLVALKRRMRS